MKSEQSSQFIYEKSQACEIQDYSFYSFRRLNQKPLYLIQFRIHKQSDQMLSQRKKLIENLHSVWGKKNIQTKNNKFMENEEFKKIQKQRRNSLSINIYCKFIQQKQKEFLKFLSICLAILIFLVLIFHENEPVQSLF